MPIISGRWRTAFTLKELMALVTILAVAFGIASPWVQRQREAARRMVCAEHMKAIGYALHGYVDVWGRLPAGQSWTFPGQSVHTAIMPYGTHDGSLYDSMVFSDSVNRQGGRATTQWYWDQSLATDSTPFRQKQIPGYICPTTGSPMVSAGWALTSYAPCNGNGNVNQGCGSPCDVYAQFMGSPIDYPPGNVSHREFPLDGAGDSVETVSGIFSNRDFFCQLSHITDGLSNTFFFGEVLFNCGEEQPWVWHPQTITSGRCTTTIPLNILATCYHAPAKQVGIFAACGRWDDSTNAGARCKALNQGFRSRHPGGANFVMGDASVHFVAEMIDENIYRCLGDREDGNVINIPFRF